MSPPDLHTDEYGEFVQAVQPFLDLIRDYLKATTAAIESRVRMADAASPMIADIVNERSFVDAGP